MGRIQPEAKEPLSSMKRAREAKEFLISQIVEEAERKGVLLSETERKMLYFSESGWTLPGMAGVYDEFESACDPNKYEKKIARIIRSAYKGACKGPDEVYDKWWASIRLLSKEDHYVLVMIRLAGLRPRHDRLKLFATASAVVAAMLAWIFVSIRYRIRLPGLTGRLHLHASLAEYVWLGLVFLFFAYQVSRFVLGAKRTDGLTSKALRQFARLSNRVK